MVQHDEFVGYLKYSGNLVKDGLLDARKTARVLLGFDSAVRFLVGQQRPNLQGIEYEIPVRIRKGSWEALIPSTIGGWVAAGLGIAATGYITAAATKIAENDFNDVSTKLIFKKALQAIQWIIRIGKHLGSLSKKRFENVKFRNDNTEIGIMNEQGEVLYVPKEMFDLYVVCNPRILENVAAIVEEDRILAVGVYSDGEVKEEKIEYGCRNIFAQDEEETEDIILPELKHGQPVTLEGDITKGNEITNKIGLQYKGHILMCIPITGSITAFKNTLFLKCKIYGIIDRTDVNGGVTAKSPKVIFSKIEPIEEYPDVMLFHK